MTNEQLILQRLDRIDSQLGPLLETVKNVNELKDDLSPLANNAVKLLIRELQDVESSFQLRDLLEMFKQLLRSVRTITYSLNQLGNIIDFVTTLEPLLRASVPQLISYLDDMEQRGVFRIINATLGVRAKIARAYTPEDIEQIGDGLVALLGVAKRLTAPQTLALLDGLAEMPMKLDLKAAKGVGPFGLLFASSSKEVKEGIGVLMELTKGLGKLKEAADPANVPS
jgi:uncharacterized protein YjgD (DUF1641 family)